MVWSDVGSAPLTTVRVGGRGGPAGEGAAVGPARTGTAGPGLCERDGGDGWRCWSEVVVSAAVVGGREPAVDAVGAGADVCADEGGVASSALVAAAEGGGACGEDEGGGVLAGACDGGGGDEEAGAPLPGLAAGLLLLLAGVSSEGDRACCHGMGCDRMALMASNLSREGDDVRAGPASAASCLGSGLGVLRELAMLGKVQVEGAGEEGEEPKAKRIVSTRNRQH